MPFCSKASEFGFLIRELRLEKRRRYIHIAGRAVLYIMGTSDFVRYDDRGNVLFDTRTTGQLPEVGQAIWSLPLRPHFVENIGGSEIRVISVELKD